MKAIAGVLCFIAAGVAQGDGAANGPPQASDGVEHLDFTPPSGEAEKVQCKPGDTSGLNGTFSRLVEDKDGRLYRKHFAITTRCVNGQWVAHTKRLN